MPKMFNIALREWRDIPENEVQGAYESGQYVFAKGELVPVALADGRYGTIKGEEFKDVIRAGGSYDLPSERKHRADEEKYDSRNAEALLLAAGRGLTFGLSDVALEKMGAYTDEEIQGLEEHNAILSGVGEIGGALAPALLTGGGSALGAAGVKGLLKKGVHYSPAGFAMRSAAAAEAAVGKHLGVQALEGGSKMLRAVPGFGAAGAVEGALFGAGETFSEELLGRTDKTAEQIMGDIGFAAVLGGGLSSAFSMAPAVVAKAFQSQAKTEYPKGLAKVVGEFKDKYTAAMTGMDEEFLAKTRDPAFLDDLLEYESFESALNTSSRENIGTLFNAVAGSTKEVVEKKKQAFAPFIKPTNEANTANAALNAIQNYIDNVAAARAKLGDETSQRIATDLISEAEGVQKAITRSIQERLKKAGLGDFNVSIINNPGQPDHNTLDIFRIEKRKARSAKAMGIVDQPQKVSYKILSKIDSDPETARMIFHAVDGLKMGQSRLGKSFAGYDGLRKFLENTDNFGKAGEMQAGLNSIWHQLIETQDDFIGHFMKREKGSGNIVAAPRKIESFLKNIRRSEKGEYDRARIFNKYTESFNQYLKVAKSLGIEMDEAVPGIVKGAEDLQEKWTNFQYLQQAKKDIDNLTRNPGLVSETLATVGGFAFGGLPGALAARYIRNIATPGDAVRRRVTAHGIKSRVSKMVDTWAEKSTGRLMRNIATPVVGKPADFLTGSKRVSLLGLIGAKATGNEEEDTMKEIEALATISSPEVLAQKIQENTEPLRDAPQIQQAMTDKGIQGTALFTGVVKENTEVSFNQITGEARVSVSDAGLAKIARAKNAIYGRSCEQLALEFSQGALTAQTVSLTDAMYPELTAAFREKCRNMIVEESEKTGRQPDLQVASNYATLNYTTAVPLQVGIGVQAMLKAMEGQQQQQQGNRSAASLKGTANRAVTPVTASMEA